MYFQTNVRKHQKSSMGLVVSVVLVLAVVGGGLFYSHLKKQEEIVALNAQAESAIASGTERRLESALKALQGSELTAESQKLQEYQTLITWMLWTDYGVKLNKVPDPNAIKVTESSSLPIVLAKAYADIYSGNLVEGEKALKQARKKWPREPFLAMLYARMALERGKSDPAQLDEANARYFKAMDVYQAMPDDALHINKAQILYGYARTSELMGNTAGAVNNYSATLTSEPGYVWAMVRNEIAKIQPEMTFEEADKAIKKMIDDNEKILSPLQRSEMHVSRALWALKTFNLDIAIDRLNEAARMDPYNVEPLIMLGRIYTQMGKVKLGAERLAAAAKIAPKNLRITCMQVGNLLASGKKDEAKALAAKVPEDAKFWLPAQVMDIRVKLADGKVDEAAEAIKKAQEKNPKAFMLKVLDAMVLAAKGDEGAKEAFDKLLPDARKNGMLALAPVLQAHAAVLADAKERGKLIESAFGAAEANQNATAVMILAKALIEDGKGEEAKPMLESAKKYGELPQIDEMLSKLG